MSRVTTQRDLEPGHLGTNLKTVPIHVRSPDYQQQRIYHVDPQYRENAWNMYGFLGLLISISSLVSWLLVNSHQNQCLGASTNNIVQILHAVCFFIGVAICIFGLLDVATSTNQNFAFYLITLLMLAAAFLSCFAAYHAYYLTCEKSGLIDGSRPELLANRAQDNILHDGKAGTSYYKETHYQKTIDDGYHGRPGFVHPIPIGHNERDHMGFPRALPEHHERVIENSPTFVHENVFLANEGKMMAVFFLDIINALLFVICCICFFNNV